MADVESQNFRLCNYQTQYKMTFKIIKEEKDGVENMREFPILSIKTR